MPTPTIGGATMTLSVLLRRKKLNFAAELAGVLRNIFMLQPLEKVLARFTQGKRVESIVGKLAPNYTAYAPGTMREATRDGIRIRVDISDFMGYMAYFGFADEANSEYFSLLKPGSTVLDIGANIGMTVLNSARRLGPQGRVIGFEPDPFNFARLKDNVALNKFSNISVENIGLGEDEAVLKLHMQTANNRGGNRINMHATEDFSLVSIRRLDDFIKAEGVETIDAIKIDVEGFELKVFRGAKVVLCRYRPLLFIELDDDNLRAQGDSAAALISFLVDCGYTNIVQAGSSAAVTASDEFTHCHFDIICRGA